MQHGEALLRPDHHFFFEPFCDRADPAMDFVLWLERPSLRALEASLATLGDVCFVLNLVITDTSFPRL
jgi:hypothetical protein